MRLFRYIYSFIKYVRNELEPTDYNLHLIYIFDKITYTLIESWNIVECTLASHVLETTSRSRN
uniref:Uncharacterized protein n=1 Tax=Helianthus annuus TaxID=4232 RepID=A0A251THT6_HELAN